MSEDLSTRFGRSSRGRPVVVNGVPNRLFARDFSVRYDDRSDSYIVELTDAGCFDEAFRFLERWIARHAEQRDGVYRPPPEDHVDFVNQPMYWMLERHCDQLFADLDSAIDRHCEYLENEMYYVPRTGDIVIEQRVAALRSLLAHFESARSDVRRAVLSPHTVEILRSASLLPTLKAE